MTKAEYQAITDRTLAMSIEEVEATLDNVPDTSLFRQIMRRYSYLSDFKASVEQAMRNVNKAYEVEFDVSEVIEK